ncbi:MAG: hypothetical protein J2P28_12050 [Actinobacteria bacterium]|nr:hypothetical protein [Actinomycetota bacterium]
MSTMRDEFSRQVNSIYADLIRADLLISERIRELQAKKARTKEEREELKLLKRTIRWGRDEE